MKMKAMSKQQLADSAGVSLRTFVRWLRPYRDELASMGYVPSMRVLPPHIVKFICDTFCIEL